MNIIKTIKTIPNHKILTWIISYINIILVLLNFIALYVMGYFSGNIDPTQPIINSELLDFRSLIELNFLSGIFILVFLSIRKSLYNDNNDYTEFILASILTAMYLSYEIFCYLFKII